MEPTYNYPKIAYYLECLLRHTRWSQGQLRNYQNRRLREVVRYAYDNVQFYHEKFHQVEIRPDDIRTVDDLKKLPMIKRDELQRNSERLISKQFNANKLKVASTSGSSGRPLLAYLTKSEDEFRKAKLLRPHVVCGQKPWDRWVLIEAVKSFAQVGRLAKLFNFYSPIFISIFDDPSKQTRRIEELQPDILDGHSNSLFLVAQEIEEKGLTGIRPRFVMGGAEQIDSSEKRLIEKSFSAPFYDQYASEEFQMIAWQCPERDEYHVDADSVLVQLVDEDGDEVGPGERGELVCTSLFNYAMPFLRYELGDLAVWSEKAGCQCGRGFPMMKMIEGRKDSLITLPGGRRVPPLAFGYAMDFYRFYRYVYQYRIVQEKLGLLRFQIKKKKGAADEAEMRRELISHIRKTLGLAESGVAIEVEFVDKIPIDKSGKLRKVISKINDSKAES